MKKFYMTRSPASTTKTDFLKGTIPEAVLAASEAVNREGGTVYVVQIILKVERDTPPVKVTVIE